LAKLSICAWKVMNTYLKSVVSDETGVPGANIAVQTYGDFLNFNPHLHAITTDGCFLNDGSFKAAPGFILEDLEEILFTHPKTGSPGKFLQHWTGWPD